MAEPEWISAAEAARRLGIKQATLYSYVSRGCSPAAGRSGRGGGGGGGAGPGRGRCRRPVAAARARAACSIPRRSRNWPAAAARAGRRAWPGW